MRAEEAVKARDDMHADNTSFGLRQMAGTEELYMST